MKENHISENKSFWSEGAFIQGLGKPSEEKMKTFHMTHDEDMRFNCKECQAKISAHNKDWHDELCDECFNSFHSDEDYEEKMIKTKCTFCSAEVNCPEQDFSSFKEFMCSECFSKRAHGKEEIGDEVYIDFMPDDLYDEVGSNFADTLVQDVFPEFWTKNKEDFKEMSKKELAEQAFGAGVYVGTRTLMKGFGEISNKKTHESVDLNEEKPKNQ